MKKILIFTFAAGACLAGHADQPIWQLGTVDGDNKEFTIPYHSWEYGRAPKLADDPNMDHESMTYHYTLPENKKIRNPRMPSALSSRWARHVMPKKEVVTGLEISWNEVEEGNRKVSFLLSGYSCYFPGLQGVTITLPDGHVRDFAIPQKAVFKNAGIALDTVFSVKPGKNSLRLEINTSSKMYRIYFDAVKLEKTDQLPNYDPILRFTPERFAGIYHPGTTGHMNFRLLNSSDGIVQYSISDYYGKTVKQGEAACQNGKGELELFCDLRGWYLLKASVNGKEFTTAYAVTEPVKKELIPDSRFGSHAIDGGVRDGNPEVEFEESVSAKMKKAFLGGARKVRIHAYQWHDLEPEKGKYRFESLRRKMELAKPYHFHVLLNVWGTPLWASRSQEKKMNVTGTFKGKTYPPREWQDWRNFVPVLMNEVRQLGIQAVEFGNEPGFQSAFWGNGSAEDYAEYLKIAYEEAKKIAPEVKILSGAPLTVDFFEEFMKANQGKPCFDIMSVHYLRNQDPDSERTKQWRSSLDKYGRDIPLVNTEESEYRGPDPVKFANDVVKLHVREAKNGVACTYAFQLFQDHGNYTPNYYSFFALEDIPLPGFAAYRTMTHRLEHAKYAADLSTEGCEIYLFDRKGVPVIVFWGEDGVKFTLPVEEQNLVLIDLMDREHKVSGNEFTASSEPKFIEGGNLPSLKNWAAISKTLPEGISVSPGETVVRRVPFPPSRELIALELPPQWANSIHDGEFSFKVPANTLCGKYNGTFVIKCGNFTGKRPFKIDVRNPQGNNLIQNGDFEQKTSWWFNLAKKGKSEYQSGIGRNGSGGVLIRGGLFFGPVRRIKVRKGEKYLLKADIRGTGRIGGVISILNAEKQRIYPKKEGINAFRFTADAEWKTVYEVISVTQENADQMSVAFLANHAKNDGELYLDNVSLVRLDMESSVAAVLYTGTILKTSQPVKIDGDLAEWTAAPIIPGEDGKVRVPAGKGIRWSGPDDLSATCRLLKDEKFLYLAFKVRDDVDVPGREEFSGQWKNDSIQFAVNPEHRYGSNFTEFLICRDKSGNPIVFKNKNFWTPEIPTNIIRQGVVPDAEAAIIHDNGITIYEAAIPWNQLYPLKANQESFGFSWVVNDNDGGGRKYLEWSSGIAGRKNSEEFGRIQENKQK